MIFTNLEGIEFLSNGAPVINSPEIVNFDADTFLVEVDSEDDTQVNISSNAYQHLWAYFANGANTTTYRPFNNANEFSTDITKIQHYLNVNARLSEMRIGVIAELELGSSCTITIMKNGEETPFTITTAMALTSWTTEVYNATTLDILSTDYLSIRVQLVGTSSGRCSVTLRYKQI